MRVAVTGASGFLGKHICHQLLRQSIEFQPFHFSKSVDFGSQARPSKPLDIGAIPDDLPEYLGETDILIHLAWGGLPNYRNMEHLDIELTRQSSFLKSAINSRIATVFVTGTCFEYGIQAGALSEDMHLLPDNPYGKAKARLLYDLLDLQKTVDFNLIWGRLFYMFGTGQASSSLWSQFQQAVANGEQVFNMSGGQQLRDFLPVEEVAKLIIKLSVDQQNHGVVNICSGNPISVESLVCGWAEKAQWSGELKLGFYPYPDYEPMAFWGDRAKLDLILSS